MSAPALVAAAHGTRDPRGVGTVLALLARVRLARPDLVVREAWVDVLPPQPQDVLADIDGPAVLVPVLLSAGFHVFVDLPRAAAGREAVIAGRLGPDPLLADVLAERLAEAGGLDADVVVLAAAGSSNPAAVADAEAVAALLAERVGLPVTCSYASAARPRVACAVTRARIEGADRVAVATYLLAPGFFADRVAAAGGDVTSAPLGDHPLIAELILSRFEEAVRAEQVGPDPLAGRTGGSGPDDSRRE